jgi:hypothetical protein
MVFLRLVDRPAIIHPPWAVGERGLPPSGFVALSRTNCARGWRPHSPCLMDGSHRRAYAEAETGQRSR